MSLFHKCFLLYDVYEDIQVHERQIICNETDIYEVMASVFSQVKN